MILYRFSSMTGEYLGSLDGTPEAALAYGPDEVLAEDVDPQREYFDPETGQIVPRPEAVEGGPYALLADGADELVLPLPAGTHVWVTKPDGWRTGGTVEDGELKFAASVPGVYIIEVWPPHPYRKQQIRVTANAP